MSNDETWKTGAASSARRGPAAFVRAVCDVVGVSSESLGHLSSTKA